MFNIHANWFFGFTSVVRCTWRVQVQYFSFYMCFPFPGIYISIGYIFFKCVPITYHVRMVTMLESIVWITNVNSNWSNILGSWKCQPSRLNYLSFTGWYIEFLMIKTWLYTYYRWKIASIRYQNYKFMGHLSCIVTMVTIWKPKKYIRVNKY